MEYTAAQARRDSDNYIDETSAEALNETLKLIKDAALGGRTFTTTYGRLDSVVIGRLANLGYEVTDNDLSFSIYW